MNKWKIAFWVCLVVLIMTGTYGFYQIIDKSVSINYMQIGYSDTESDLESLIEIINNSELNKAEIEKILKQHDNYEFMNFKTDTVSLKRSTLLFNNNKLEKIKLDW